MQPGREIGVELRQRRAGDDLLRDRAEQEGGGDQDQRAGTELARQPGLPTAAGPCRAVDSLYRSFGAGSALPAASRPGVDEITPQAMRAPELPVGCVV